MNGIFCYIKSILHKANDVSLFSVSCFLFVLNSPLVSAQVVINELDSDTPGSDVLEFVELKSATPNFSLNGYVLVFFNAGSTSPYANSASYYAIDLDGYATDINGIATFGNPTLSPTPLAIIPNATIQNGPDVVALYQDDASSFPINSLATTTNLVDAIAYSGSGTTSPTAMMTTLGITVCVNENATSNVATHSIQRKNDGTYEVKMPTPGMPNDGSGILLNTITVSTSQLSYIEGESFTIIFTISQPIQNQPLVINFSLINGNFSTNDYSGVLSVTLPVGATTAQTTIQITDDTIDEGDEELVIDLQSAPSGYVNYNDNIILRIYDNDYTVQSFGTPLNPTYGLVTPTIPSGYYDALEGLSGSALKQAVQDIIANPSLVRLHSYSDIWDIIRTADQNPLNSNQVWCMYIESPMAKIDQQNGTSIVGKWNREHIFCQSRGGFEVSSNDTADGINFWNATSAATVTDGVSDAHHIRIENGQENSSRNNKNYGTVNSATVYAGPTNTQGSWHGDVARALFYMAVRFNGLNVVAGDPSEYLPNTTTASGNIGDLATLLTWHQTDPRDDYEMNRNNYIYTWQMNRNPFIDHPSLVQYIFGANYGQQWFSALSNQQFSSTHIVVYPNPTSDYIIISGVKGKAFAKIHTLTGQLIHSFAFENELQVACKWNPGMYLITIAQGTTTVTKKIIIR
ncbi:MAG: T9SS type A sorting domain-containing protein [Flavobacterium sp.]|nr:MAG: T9SS type A sorting domain-containing protein [Flavobacterium sp.]